ncbi:MAG TPA: hypothetical protein VNE16_01250 [Vicinamibacterales bacterium]|nr:hypothetical protein [Vicinamibacterales bacterium]
MNPARRSTDLAHVRAWYAEELRFVANIESEAVVAAFAAVPRERFLGEGPWQIWTTSTPRDPYRPHLGYRTTPDADPAHVYHNVAIALDAGRQINNGQPSAVASWLDLLALAPGMTAYHVGAGTGYYTAILAHIVGATGRVAAVEIDEALARTAQARLAAFRHVDLVHATAGTHDPGPVDAMLVSVGVTEPLPVWLSRLRPHGRMLLPLTFSLPGGTVGAGAMLAVHRLPTHIDARFLPGQILIYSGIDLRTDEANDRLGRAFGRGGSDAVRSLRTPAHAEDGTCWLHGTTCCLSTIEGGV